jgi:glycosyltransferase involved in cell wall biosynthesis
MTTTSAPVQEAVAAATGPSPRWLGNLALLRECRFADGPRQVDQTSTGRGGVADAVRLHARSLVYDVLVLYQPPALLTWVLCLLRRLTPGRKPHLVLLDIVFTRPRPGWRGRVEQTLKRWLYRQVSLFVSFMHHLAALESFYGIEPRRHEFVPFKVNAFARRFLDTDFPEGEYVFTGGRSRRDFGTFCAAMTALDYPAVVVTPHAEEGASHETYLDEAAVPPNVRVVHDDGSAESWLRWMAGAKLVALCLSDNSISPSGVGVYLQAMGLGKCVVLTECPASRGILEDGNQALIVGQRDPEALAAAIRQVWDGAAWRRAIAARGRQYAASLGTERDLIQRFAAVIARRFG